MSDMPRQQGGAAGPAKPPPARKPAPPALFLRTKLLPPRPAPSLLPRPRLIERLLHNLPHPVTLVTANAGSGKTTLVADFVRAHAQQYVWYQLDRTDADPLVFLGYVTHGIRQAVPSFGEATLTYLHEATGESAQQPERAVDVLLNEVLDHVEQQLVLVLDDYHHLGAETPVHRVVDRLLAYLPDVMHVIIVSRDPPPLAVARLRAQSPLAVIDRDELLFTDEETRQLFRQAFDLELSAEQLAEYRERTHGWITALQLVRQMAQRRALARGTSPGGEAGATPPDLVGVLRQSERDIFDYFAEEVFADETEDVRELLLRVSLLERVEPEACGRLFPGAHATTTLQMLVRRNVFITLASGGGGEEYRLHPLFRSFLNRRLRAELGPAGVAAEHRRVADYFLGAGQLEQAVRHLLAAEDFGRAAAVVAARGAAWIAAGAFGSLVAVVEALPADTLEAHPRALSHRAEVARLRGEFDAAQALFRRAAKLLHERGDREGEADALHSLAAIARRAGDCQSSFAYLDRAAALTDESSPVRPRCGNTRGLCLTGLDQWAEAEREFRAALQLAEEQGDAHYARLIAHNLALPAAMRGDFGQALRWLRRLVSEDAGAPPVPQEAVARLNMARCHLTRGDLAAVEQHLERALELCQTFNLSALRGEIFEAYGNLYRERGDTARAAEHYERAARAYDEAGIDPTRRELLEEQALLNLQAGDLPAARALADRLVSARSAAGDGSGISRTPQVDADSATSSGAWGVRDALPGVAGRSVNSQVRPCRTTAPREARSPSASVTVGRRAPTSAPSVSCVSVTGSVVPAGVTRPHDSASSQRRASRRSSTRGSWQMASWTATRSICSADRACSPASRRGQRCAPTRTSRPSRASREGATTRNPRSTRSMEGGAEAGESTSPGPRIRIPDCSPTRRWAASMPSTTNAPKAPWRSSSSSASSSPATRSRTGTVSATA